jgi:hypothetical protein
MNFSCRFDFPSIMRQSDVRDNAAGGRRVIAKQEPHQSGTAIPGMNLRTEFSANSKNQSH